MQSLDRILDVFGLREIQSPMCLDTYSVYADAFFLQFLDHGDDAIQMGWPPYIEVIVVKFRIRGISVCGFPFFGE